MKFAERLKELRLSANLSQIELSEKLGLSRSAVNMYERGVREPKSLDLLEQIADFFRVDLNYLLGKTDVNTYYEPTENELNELALSDPYNRSELPLTRKDKKDIQDALDEMKQQLLDGDLLFDGNPVSDEDSAAIIAAMETAMTIVKLKNKETYRRKKE